MKLPNPKTEQYHPFWDEGIRNPKKFKPDRFHKRYDRKRFYNNIFKEIDKEDIEMDDLELNNVTIETKTIPVTFYQDMMKLIKSEGFEFIILYHGNGDQKISDYWKYITINERDFLIKIKLNQVPNCVEFIVFLNGKTDGPIGNFYGNIRRFNELYENTIELINNYKEINNKIKYTRYIPDNDFRVDFYEQLVKPTLSWKLEHSSGIVEYVHVIYWDDDEQFIFIDGENELMSIIPSEVIVECGQYLNLIKGK
jgi:hypothetical protein